MLTRAVGALHYNCTAQYNDVAATINATYTTCLHQAWMQSLQKKAAPEGEKPEAVRTHLRDVVVLPEMIGSLVGVYNGKTFNQVEIKVC